MINISEPIYENVPLPWTSHQLDRGVVENRSRTSSIQSAPEIHNMTSCIPVSSSSFVIDRKTTSTTTVAVTEDNKHTNVNANTRDAEIKNAFSSPTFTVSSSSIITSASHSVSTSIGKLYNAPSQFNVFYK